MTREQAVTPLELVPSLAETPESGRVRLVGADGRPFLLPGWRGEAGGGGVAR